MRRWLAALLLALLPAPASAQDAEEIHAAERAMQGLGPLRPGASGNAAAPNAANSDEARVGTLAVPPLFATPAQGSRAGWLARRAELARLLEDHWLGRVPEAVADLRLHWIKRPLEDGREHWIGQVIAPDGTMGPSVDAIITFASSRSPAPALVDFTYVWPNGRAPAFPGAPAPDPVALVTGRGWAHVAYRPQLLQPDDARYMRWGIVGMARWPRAANDWGALRAWAWGASALRQELARDPRIAGERISLAGHSRFGKAVLVAAAFDHGFADALVSSSGAGGAKLMRRDFGERIENLAGPGTFHWFAPALMAYAHGDTSVADWPVDAHMLIALRAPRPILITSGLAERGDAWVDPAGMWRALSLAQPAWDLHGASVPLRIAMPVAGSREQAHYPAGWFQHLEGHVMWPALPAFLDHAERFAGE